MKTVDGQTDSTNFKIRMYIGSYWISRYWEDTRTYIMECLGSYWISWKLEQKLFHLTYSWWNKTTAIFLNPVRILGSRGTKIVKLKMEARNGLTRIWIFMELMLSVNHLFNRLPLQELVESFLLALSSLFYYYFLYHYLSLVLISPE